MIPADASDNGVSLHSQEPRIDSLTYAQMLDEVRALFVGKRHHIEIAHGLKGREKKDEAWFKRAYAVQRALEAIGAEFRVIANNAESYDAWKASLPSRKAP